MIYYTITKINQKKTTKTTGLACEVKMKKKIQRLRFFSFFSEGK